MKNITSFFLLISSFVFAQTATGNIENYLGNIIDSAAGSSGDNYVVPNTSQLNSWNTVIDFLLVENIGDARLNASSINYQVTEFTDTSITPSQVFYVLEEKSEQSNYWGTFVFSKTPTRNNLIIQAPHSQFDTNTGKEAVYCFKKIVARAVFINGTHRCNSNSFSSCSGTTSACGSSDFYKVSDMAHNVNSIFQKTTEIIFRNISNSVFIQLHGFAKRSTDPYVIISNGTRETPTTDYASLIEDALLTEDNLLTFKLAHINTNWARLIGFTNTQGRLINDSSDYCNTSATTTSGRFIHIEQEKSKLRNDETGWRKMSNALSKVFSNTLSVNQYNLDNSIFINPNPVKDRLIIQSNDNNIESIDVFNLLGQILIKHKNINQRKYEISLLGINDGIFFVKINTKTRITTKRIIHL